MRNIESVPFLIASSVTARLPHQFSLEETINIAKGAGADGTQLYINPDRFIDGNENSAYLKDLLSQAGFKTNVVHLPGYLIPEHLKSDAFDAASIASRLISPIKKIGKLCVIHHSPFSGYSNKEIVESVNRAFDQLQEPNLAIGFEHYHPPKLTKQNNLEEQIDRYIELLYALQQNIPAFAVFDIGRLRSFNNANDPKAPLEDPNFYLLEKMSRALSNQSILMHIDDWKTNLKLPREEDNSTKVGKGILTPYYKKMAEFARKYSIKFIAFVDETEDITQISDKQKVLDIFR